MQRAVTSVAAFCNFMMKHDIVRINRGEIMLNQRQSFILKDLESAIEPITAKALAVKYNISLRTIRNDINEISDYVNTLEGVNFIKVPGLGMRIAAEKNIYSQLEKEINLENLSIYRAEDRSHVLLFCFLLLPNPLTAEELADKMLLSKNTIINELKAVNEQVKDYHLQIIGRKNHGYYLKGEEIDIIALINALIEKANKKKIQYLLFENEETFLSHSEKRQIDQLLNFINDDLVLMINDYVRLKIWLAFFVKRCSYGNSLKLNHNYYVEVLNDENHSKIERLAKEIYELFGFELNQGQIEFLTFIIANYTYWVDDKIVREETSRLVLAVDAMLKEAQKVYPELSVEYDQLKNDILTHIQLTLNRYKLNLPNTNPILTQIKTKYGEIFAVVENASKAFEKVYGLRMDEDEIGFLTLYFCRSLEKSHQLSEARILVVCNTGRGASKLLAARIMNNMPEVHIVGMIPILDLERQSDLIENVDLILSTIPLHDIQKPVVLVSPFVSEQEILRIKEVIIEGKTHGKPSSADATDLLNSLITQYVPGSKVNEFSAKLGNLINFNFTAPEPAVLSAEIYAETCVETCIMMSECAGIRKGVDTHRLSGILAHIVMSLPRWDNGRFISASDYEEMKKMYAKEYEIVMKFLHVMEEKLSVYIDPIEAVAILRYLI